ncbi:Stress-induced-phosphoprotein 1 [Operophtera brumata]|uniref:Stress-induced-phosphoprotein 1 n=1 Tax=Operophtera brumata TaxID=104452 RepID=A0A0L7KR11_OPEBR|nr:Stress-induced-phosphoprotein 1 [Operophtera brumata]
MDDTKETKKGGQTASIEDLKNKGNECVKDGKFIEAVLHYTQAIKLDPNNYVLYSNRSLAFLKLDQHYLSLQDANETVLTKIPMKKKRFQRKRQNIAKRKRDNDTSKGKFNSNY